MTFYLRVLQTAIVLSAAAFITTIAGAVTSITGQINDSNGSTMPTPYAVLLWTVATALYLPAAWALARLTKDTP